MTTGTSNWVVRAGVATADLLQLGYAKHKAVTGLFGFSVQYEPGQSVDALAQAGRFRNAQISYADAAELERAVQSLGYTVRLVKSPGNGFHHTFAVLYTISVMMLQSLPRDAAEALSQTFTRMPNPHRIL
jgi:hypothetical protein